MPDGWAVFFLFSFICLLFILSFLSLSQCFRRWLWHNCNIVDWVVNPPDSNKIQIKMQLTNQLPGLESFPITPINTWAPLGPLRERTFFVTWSVAGSGDRRDWTFMTDTHVQWLYSPILRFTAHIWSTIWAASWQNQQNGMCAQRRLRSVWASAQSHQSSLCAQWVAKDPSCLHADSKDSDQTGRMPRLIWVFAGRTCHFVGFVMKRLTLEVQMSQCMRKEYLSHRWTANAQVNMCTCTVSPEPTLFTYTLYGTRGNFRQRVTFLVLLSSWAYPFEGSRPGCMLLKAHSWLNYRV